MNGERIAAYKADEENRFSSTELDIVAVKSAPWADEESRSGWFIPSDIRRGRIVVYKAGRPLEPIATYPSLDFMLDEWVGD